MNNLFPILAIETSGDLCSAAVLKNESAFVESSHLEKHVHSRKLLGMIDFVIKEADYSIDDISSIAVSVGPGSFTGLRIGMAAAKGLAFGSGKAIIPVNTFDALALQISSLLPAGIDFTILKKASIEDVYFAKYRIGCKNFQSVSPLALIQSEMIRSVIVEGEHVFGNVSLAGIDMEDIHLSAVSAARWAYIYGKDLLTFEYENLEPNYLKQFIGKVKR